MPRQAARRPGTSCPRIGVSMGLAGTHPRDSCRSHSSSTRASASSRPRCARRRARAAPHAGAGARRGGGRPHGHPGQPGPPRHELDPMCIGRASLTKVNANMGASPVSAAPTRRSRSFAGPSAGAPTRSWTSRPAATSTRPARRSSATRRCRSARCPSTR